MKKIGLCLLVLIPFLFGISLLHLGIADELALRYLDEGAFSILRVWKEVYPHGPFYWGTFDPNYIYPKAFYNLAGFFLYPFSFFQEDNFYTILVVWRGLNLFLSAAALLVLYFLVRRAFRSEAIAFFTAFLFALTPEFLTWSVNVRPNPMELLLVFLALYFCLRLCEGFSYAYFLGAAFSGAGAFATKYGGLPIFFLLPLLAVYQIYRIQGAVQKKTILEQQVKIFRKAFLILIPLLAISSLFLFWSLWRHGFDAPALFLDWTRGVFPSELFSKVVLRLGQYQTLVNGMSWALLAALILLQGALWFFWQRFKKGRDTSWIFLLFSFWMQSSAIYLATFFMTSPAYLSHPTHLLSEIAYTFFYMSLGGSFGAETVPGFLGYMQRLAVTIPGFWFFLPFIVFGFGYSIWVKKESEAMQDQLRLLGLYILISIYFLVSMADPQLRHILPGVGLLYAFGLFSVFGLWRSGRFSRQTQVLGVAVGVLSLVVFQQNISHALEDWQMRKTSFLDIGFVAGEWIQNNFESDTKILTDQWAIYTPPAFKNVATTTFTEWKSKRKEEQEKLVSALIQDYSPDLILVTHDKRNLRTVPVDQLLQSSDLIKNRYQYVRDFVSKRSGDRVERIQIFGTQKVLEFLGRAD